MLHWNDNVLRKRYVSMNTLKTIEHISEITQVNLDALHHGVKARGALGRWCDRQRRQVAVRRRFDVGCASPAERMVYASHTDAARGN